MKKLFALALAATMAAGMTTVAFAASEGVYIDGSTYYVLGSDNRANLAETDDEYKGGDQLVIPIRVWDDKNEDGKFNGGNEDLGYLTYTSDYDKNVVVRANWRVGEDLDVIVDTDWVNYSKLGNLGTRDSQIMSVIITLPENDTTTIEDLAGTIRVGRTSSAAKKGPEFDFGVSFFPDATRTGKPVPYDGGELISGHTGIVSFEQYEGEIDIDFEDFATFTVNIDGQGKLNLAWNTDFNKEFGAMYDYANLYFFNFEGEPVFNKTGTMMVYAEPDTFIYEVTADGAKAIDEAEYDEDYEAWIFETRALTSYVISDVELTEKTVTDTEDDTTDDGSKPIPDTGR